MFMLNESNFTFHFTTFRVTVVAGGRCLRGNEVLRMNSCSDLTLDYNITVYFYVFMHIFSLYTLIIDKIRRQF